MVDQPGRIAEAKIRVWRDHAMEAAMAWSGLRLTLPLRVLYSQIEVRLKPASRHIRRRALEKSYIFRVA
jgi:hypothetical protein